MKNIVLNTNKSNRLIVSTIYTSSLNTTIPIKKDGYAVLGVVGWVIPNAGATLVQCYIRDGNLILASNITTDIGCAFDILYVKN